MWIRDSDIATNNADLYIGSNAGAGSYLDGTIDDVMIWDTALSGSTIEKVFWSGDGSYYPIIDADDGDYSFKVTADDVLIRKFEVYNTAIDDDGTGILVDEADDVTLDKIIAKSNDFGIRILDSDDVKIYSVTIN